MGGSVILAPKLSKGFFKNIKDEQIQQCGFDLTVKEIYKIDGEGQIDFTNEKRTLPRYEKIFDSEFDEKIKLNRGVYIIKVNEYIKIPKDVAAFVYPRSSLLRMGSTLYSAVHDPGYEGKPEYLLNVFNPITIYRYARICQIVFVKCEGVEKLYNGIYKGR